MASSRFACGSGPQCRLSGTPTEREADAAATSYAQRVLAEAELAELAALDTCRGLVASLPYEGDAVAETVELLNSSQAWGHEWWGAAERTEFLERVRRSVQNWDPTNEGTLAPLGQLPLIEVVELAQ